jgi:hypothetical protein
MTTFVAAYIWIVMGLGILSSFDQRNFDSHSDLGVDFTWAFALDSICLGLLMAGIVVGHDTRLTSVGLAMAILGFGLRLAEFMDPNNMSMYWFEPFVRSGIYVLSFALAHAANRFSAPAQT